MQTPASACPGYKHVEAFSNDDGYYESEEEEVSYVTLDLGDVEPQLVPNASGYRLIVRFHE
jgi:general transcription factor 3C polypeptide 6